MALTQLKRGYFLSDADMIEEARTRLGFFEEDKADFVGFDPDFDDPYHDDVETKIDDAEAFPDDETIDDQTTQLTESVEVAMENGRRKFQDTKFFIEKAFP